MRYSLAALSMSLALALSSSVLHSAPNQSLDPRAAALELEGKAALGAGNVQGAIDSFEAALAIQPGSVVLMLDLADANRKQGLQGKALHYYRVALGTDSQNLDAIAGEGGALVEKGAIEKAKRSLLRLESLCNNCAQAQLLSAQIAKGPTVPAAPDSAVAQAPVATLNEVRN
ncbi:MAG: hypothetical protein RLZZ136_233 [Pseudomonadota bacterium]